MESCNICFENFINQEIGIPEHCGHMFCFDCLVEWSEQQNSCPNDRGKFEFIMKKRSFSSHRPHAKVDIKNTGLEIVLEEEDFLPCYACDDKDEEYHPLLICNGCRQSYHEYCLNSSDGSRWICPSCDYDNEERPELVNHSMVVPPARTRQTISGLRDRNRITKRRRSLQQITPHNVIRRTESLITRKPPPSSMFNQKQEKHVTSSSVRSVITPQEAARRLAVSGLPILPCSRSSALISQAKYMSALRCKRKRVARLPARIAIQQLPRIQRRTDAPLRSKTIAHRAKSLTNRPFLDKLLYSQNQLYSLGNIRIQGAHIEL